MDFQNYNKIVHETIKWRGIIIHQISQLERALDNYIIYYLVGKSDEFKISQMQLLLFGDNRITIDNKKQVFHKIASQYDLNWYKSYKSIRKAKNKSKGIDANIDLDYIIYNRNIFAHCIADTRDEAIGDIENIGFIRFKDEAQTIKFTQLKLAELELIIVSLTKFFLERNQK